MTVRTSAPRVHILWVWFALGCGIIIGSVLGGTIGANAAELLPDCTEADKRDSTGIVRAGDEATITFTLTRDCAVSLWSYAQPGPRGARVDSAVVSGIGTHTLAVRACAQVDFVPGPTHERGSGEAFNYERFEEAQCESPAPIPTTTPSTTTTSTTVSPTTSAPTATTAPSPVSCVPDCENPDAPEHVPALAYGGYDVGDALPWALAVVAGVLLVGASRLWESEG